VVGGRFVKKTSSNNMFDRYSSAPKKVDSPIINSKETVKILLKQVSMNLRVNKSLRILSI
jgi:hypothetical protein